MGILVGKRAPTFTTQAVLADGEIVGDYDFGAAIKGKYAVVFFYPMDFTFVCPSEIIAMGARTAKLKELGCEVVGISVDSHWTHNAWRNTAVSDGELAPCHSLAADMTRKIAKKYGVLSKGGDSTTPQAWPCAEPSSSTRRASSNMVVNGKPQPQHGRGRPHGQALQFFEQNGQVCPAGWNQGDAGMNNTPDGVASYLAENSDKL